jgi:hypothetical protein
MANCPNCGSSHIQLKRETNVNWGRTVAGWALFGVVGGAVGAVTGEDRNANACLDCGTSWKATDLFKTLQTINNLTGVTLDLARAQDRSYMNNFMDEIGCCLESISNLEKKDTEITITAENKSYEKTATGCGYGCLASIGLFIAIAGIASASTSGGLILLLILAPPVVGFWAGRQLDKRNKKLIEQEAERAKKEAARMKVEAQENLRLKVREFMQNNPL